MREWGAIISEKEWPTSSPNVARSCPGGGRSSCVSTGVPGVDPLTYPVDLITARTPCELHISARNITIKVASGVAYPRGSYEYLHGRPIPEGYTVVEVDEAVDQYHHVEVDYTAEDGENTIGENEHTFISWEKVYIVFPPGTAPETLLSTTPRATIASKISLSSAISQKKSTFSAITSKKSIAQEASHQLGKQDQVLQYLSRRHHLRSWWHIRS